MIASALAVSAALLGIAAALLFAIRAREAERDSAGLSDRLASALREAERLRALSRVEESDRAGERDRLLRRAMAAEAAAREWSASAERARCELAEADRAIVHLSNERDTLSAGYDLLRARLDARDLAGRSAEVAS
jgi:hypothetical protein